MVDWAEEWLAVHVGATGRGDRTALRSRERLLALVPVGMDTGTLFVLRDLPAPDTERARQRWNVSALDTAYRDTTAHLSAWFDQTCTCPLDQAAREAFAIDHDAIRQLVYDPLLRAPMIDVIKAGLRFKRSGSYSCRWWQAT